MNILIKGYTKAKPEGYRIQQFIVSNIIRI